MADLDTQQAKWDLRYRRAQGAPAVAEVLADNLHLLPQSGEALDLACGRGANALRLAEHGLTTWAWDLSPVAVAYVEQAGNETGLAVRAEVREVVTRPPAADRFDVIVVAHFLERALAPALVAALRPGGLLFYQTFINEKVTDRGPDNPAYRLERNELLRLFPTVDVVVYREEARIGNTARGFRDQAMLVASKP
jgi:tellurite methyltransferase